MTITNLTRARSRVLSRGGCLLLAAILALAHPFATRAAQADPPSFDPLATGASIVFNRLSVKDGLSFATARSLLQDQRGFLWVGATGLNRYDGYSFTNYSSERETPTELRTAVITTLAQSPDGLLWLGSLDDGLATYDPRSERFAHYRHDPGDRASLGNNQIRSLSFDATGGLWIGTFGGGLDRFDPRSGTFTHFRHDEADPTSLSDDRVLGLFQSRDGTIWVATFGGLDRFDPQTGTFSHFRHDATDPDSLSDDRVWSVYEDRAGRLWAGTFGGGLDRFDPRSGTFTHFRHDEADPTSLSSDIVTALHEDKTGRLWVGTFGGGLNRFDPDTARFTHWTRQEGDTRSLPNNNIYALLEDRSGLLWIATDGGGIASVELYRRSFLRFSPTPAGLSHDVVRGLASDHDGNFWVGTYGGGLNRYDPGTGTISHFRHDDADPSSLPDDLAWSVYVDRDNVVWVGTDKGYLSRLDRATGRFTSYRPAGSDTAGYRIHAIYEDRDGVLWVGSNGGGLSRFDRATESFTTYRYDATNPRSLSNDFVIRIYEDHGGTLWVGTFGGGLNRFDRATESFTTYRYDATNPQSLSGDTVTAIAEDGSGRLWVGTTTGLNRFDPATQSVTRVTERYGLQSNLILSILEADGVLWLSSQRGLTRLDPSTLATRSFSFTDGLPEDGFTLGSLDLSPSGLIAGGGFGGFVVFDPATLAEPTPGPSLALLGIRVNNLPVAVGETSPLRQALDETSQLVLPAGSRSFTVEVAALDFHASAEQLYRHRLDGDDQMWREGGTEGRFITYTNLDPGTYLLRMAASNPGGYWTEPERRLMVTILPFWWESLWFRVALATLGGLIVVGLVQYRIINLRTRQRQLEQQVASRTEELVKQAHELEQTNAQLATTSAQFRQAATEAQQSRDDFESLLVISNGIVSMHDIDALLDVFLEHLARVVANDSAYVATLDGNTLTIRAFHTRVRVPDMRGRIIDVSRVPAIQRLVTTQQPILVDDLHRDSQILHYAEELIGGAVVNHAWIAVPLFANQRVIGLLSLLHQSAGYYRQADLQRVQAYANQVAIAIQNTQLHERDRQAAVLEERNRLARELHDAVTQTVFSASLIAEALPTTWHGAPPIARKGIEQLHQLTRTALAEMRSLLVELRPAALTERPLGELLRALCSATGGRSGIPIRLEVRGACQELRPEVQIALYRLTQEALNNVIKHADASEARVTLECRPAEVMLAIHDDGRGFDPAHTNPDTFGLQSMRERAAQIGATLQIQSQLHQGTIVAIEWRAPVQGAGPECTGPATA